MVVYLGYITETSLLLHYLVSEDEAQDPSNQLEQEDHCQTDAELPGGGDEEREARNGNNTDNKSVLG